MATIDALEAQVTERKEQAQLLMQAVLREAFAGGEGTESRPQTEGPIPTPALPLKGRERTASRRARRERTDLPLVAEPATVYTPGNIPQRILAVMQPGREYSRADLLSAAGIREADWIWAIRQLKEDGRVRQTGERRGARYRRKE